MEFKTANQSVFNSVKRLKWTLIETAIEKWHKKKKKRHKWKKAKGKRSERERMKEGGREWVALCFSAKGSILNLHIALVVYALRLLSTSRGKGRGDWEGSIGSASPAIVALNMQMNIFYLQCTIMFNRILMRHGPDTCHVNWERNENPRKLNRHGQKKKVE